MCFNPCQFQVLDRLAWFLATLSGHVCYYGINRDSVPSKPPWNCSKLSVQMNKSEDEW
jgi:hypothetical protein